MDNKKAHKTLMETAEAERVRRELGTRVMREQLIQSGQFRPQEGDLERIDWQQLYEEQTSPLSADELDTSCLELDLELPG